MAALIRRWLEGEANTENPGLALSETQAEAGPLMPIMMRHANMAPF
jgi:hypothetical protein